MSGCHLCFVRCLFTRASALIFLATQIACAVNLAQLPSARHERASFNAPQLAARLVTEVPVSLISGSPDHSTAVSAANTAAVLPSASQMAQSGAWSLPHD